MEKAYELANVDRILFHFSREKIETIVSFHHASVYPCLVPSLAPEPLVPWEAGRMDVYFNTSGLHLRNKMVSGVSSFIEFVV